MRSAGAGPATGGRVGAAGVPAVLGGVNAGGRRHVVMHDVDDSRRSGGARDPHLAAEPVERAFRRIRAQAKTAAEEVVWR